MNVSTKARAICVHVPAVILLYFITAAMRPADEYYSSRNGKFLGSDGATTTMPRLIAEDAFQDICLRHAHLIGDRTAAAELAAAGRPIVIDDAQIQHDLQMVRDLSMGGTEYQLYIILDLKKALVTSVMSHSGTNLYSYFEYYPAPGLGANMPVGPDDRRMTFTVILAGVHGHPDAAQPRMLTLSTMSTEYDAVVAKTRQVPIYGIDAMSSTGLPGSVGRIHRANPDGTIDNTVGWTQGRGKPTFNLGRDALVRWGRSGPPE